VNEQGELMTNANGLFNAKFPNLTGGSSDCVIVGGVAHINVRINPYTYSLNNPNAPSLELNQLQLWGNNKMDVNGNPDCRNNQSDGTPELTGFFVYGCNTIDVSTLAPQGMEYVPESSYPDLENSLQTKVFGRIFIGTEADAVRNINQYFREGIYQELWNAIKSLPIIGSFTTILEQAGKCLSQAQSNNQKCDVGALLFAAAQLALEVVGGVVIQGLSRASGVILKGIGKLFQQSLTAARVAQTTSNIAASASRGIGTLSKYLEEVIAKLVGVGVRSGDAIAARLEELVGGVAELVSRCSKTCRNNVDNVLVKVRTGVNGAVQFAGKTVDDALLGIKKYFQRERDPTKIISTVCRAKIATQLIGVVLLGATQTALELGIEDTVGKTINLTLGELNRLFFEPTAEAREIDGETGRARIQPRAAPTTPTLPASCPHAARVKALTPKYSTKTNWNAIKNFEGSSADITNVPKGYNFGEFIDNGKPFQTASWNQNVPNTGQVRIIQSKDGGWYFPAKPTNRITNPDLYEKNVPGGKKLIGDRKGQIGHLFADELWQTEPMLLALLRECGGAGVNNYPDNGKNLLEHATRETHLNPSNEPDFANLVEKLDANGNGTGKAANGIDPPTRSRILHRGNHPNYTRWMQLLLYQEIDNERLPANKRDWKQSDCGVMQTILESVQNRIRNLFVFNRIPVTTTVRNQITGLDETLTLLEAEGGAWRLK
jgi:hypothetical protein